MSENFGKNVRLHCQQGEAEDHVRLYGPHAEVDGKNLAQWSEEWLKWVFHSPAATPPGTPFGAASGFPEGSPDNASVNNDGDVFFLYGGDWGNANHPVIPTIDVPAGKPIFLPMINAFDIEGPGIETIPGFVASNRGSFADEAKFVTHLALESPGFAPNFGSCGEVEGVHLVGVLTFGDEFREDVGWVGIQQKFRKALA